MKTRVCLKYFVNDCSFGPDFGPFGPNFELKIYFSLILLLLDIRHCCNLSLYAISGKTNENN